jgi:hypothetical protein
MPGCTPTTSSTGSLGKRSPDSFAGQSTLPRISLATCSDVAGAEELALEESGLPTIGLLLLLQPANSNETAANAHAIYGVRNMGTSSDDRFVLCKSGVIKMLGLQEIS